LEGNKTVTLTIFCPSSHLILDAPVCPVCGWKRPETGALGETAWEHPLELGAELGGPGRHVFARLAAARGLAVLPLQGGSLVGISLADGQAAWRTPLEAGLRTRLVLAYGNRLLAPLSDERQFTEAEHGRLAAVSPDSGKLATLWQADTPLLSLPVLKDDLLFLRTSKPELVALRLGSRVTLAWRAGLNSAGAMLPPCVAGKNIFVSDGEGLQGRAYLNVFEAVSGRLLDRLPTEGMLSQPMAALEDVLIFQDGRKYLVGLDSASLAILWKKELERIYTPPSAGSGSVLLMVRGAAGKDTPGYYSLLSIHPRSGETLWSAPIPARIFIPPVEAQGRIYLGSEDGQLLCLDAQTGYLLWKYTLGGEEHPLRTELLLFEGLLVAGTYDGKVAALRVSALPEKAESPDVYEARGDFESAAAAYALRGNFRKAGKIYAETIQELDKAFLLYEHDQLYQEAGNLARSKGMLLEAEGYFKLAGDLQSQADMALERGDKLGAARLYEQAGKLKKAASLYEDAGENGKAIKLYQILGDVLSVLRLQKDTPASLEDIDFLEHNGKYPEAAEAAVKAGLLPRAAKLFERAEKPERELDVLKELAPHDQEAEWAWSRIAALAKKLGRFAEEADAWEHLGKVVSSAEAYHRAAQQAEQKSPEAREKIAGFYKKAAHYYQDADRLEEEQQCKDRMAKYLCQPVVVIDGHAHKEFKELEWNTLDLEVRNEGYGMATEIHWKVDSERFEIDPITSRWALDRLAEGGKRQVKISIRPKKGEIGTEVPFLLEWFWKCKDGDAFKDNLRLTISVKGKDDTRPTGQPVIFQGGTLIQTDKYVAGDEMASGSLKGNKEEYKVEIQRGSGVKVSSSDERVEIGPDGAAFTRKCPVCSLPVEPDAKVCSACGNPLPVVTKRRK
jgi:outer membrane protein assembly factor BamB